MRTSPTYITFLLLALRSAMALAEETPPPPRMSYLDNGTVKIGVDLNRGGAITFLSRGGGANLINNYDLGRQVQLSFYSGPVPFSTGDKHPAEHWKHLGWNPIQAGDDWKHGSKVLEHRNDGQLLYVKCIPMQWPLDDVPGECTFESWLELNQTVVKARARLNNARSDATQYPARLQELPALYANAPFHRVLSYTGDRPFTGDALTQIARPAPPRPWSSWQGTEGWAALLDAADHGIGLITPGRTGFCGGFAGQPGPNDTHGVSTGYLAGQALEILDHHITYEYRYELLPGTLAEIRARALAVRSEGLPAWTFAKDRQGWHYQNASDKGWPIEGQLDVILERPDPQLIGPLTFWQAEEAPYVIIEAAYHTGHRSGMVYWQRHGDSGPAGDDNVTFPIQPDGEFHRYVAKLAEAPTYKGAMVRLRFDPTPDGAAGDWVRVRAIKLSKSTK